MTDAHPADGHGKCGAKGRSGNPCSRPAGWGTQHVGAGRCKLHGGSTPTHAAAASKELARQACTKLGIPIDTHPAEALLREVCETAGNVQFYRSLVQELPTHPEAPEVDYVDEDGKAHYTAGEPGVYGPTYHVSGIATGEAKPHVLVQLYNEERKHLLAATTAALKAGCDAKRVQIEEDKATQLADVLRSFAIALGHDPSSEIVRTAFRAQLSVIAGGAA